MPKTDDQEQINEKGDIVASVEPAKRGRGRPPKNLKASVKPAVKAKKAAKPMQKDEVNGNTIEGSSSEEAKENGSGENEKSNKSQPKKRGRPPKKEKAAAASINEEPPVKRGRGRPKKNP